jgi:hypothetical protein
VPITKIFVKTSTDRSIALSVQGSNKFDHVKGQLQALLGTPPSMRHLFFGGSMMSGDWTLDSCLKNESMLQMIVSQPQGLAGLGHSRSYTPAPTPATTPAPGRPTIDVAVMLPNTGGGSNHVTIQVANHVTIQTCLRMVQEKIGILADRMMLSCNGEQLRPQMTIGDYDIGEHDVLQVRYL